MLLSLQDSAVMKYRGGSVDDRFIDYNVIICYYVLLSALSSCFSVLFICHFPPRGAFRFSFFSLTVIAFCNYVLPQAH